MTVQNYDPNSFTALLSRIIERLDRQDEESTLARSEMKGLLTEIRTETRKTNGRVTVIEQWIMTTKAKVAILSLIGGGAVTAAVWVIEKLLAK